MGVDAPPECELPVVALLGATGRVGGWVLLEGLRRGYKMRVLARDPSRIPADIVAQYSSHQLAVIAGSATDQSAVANLLEGATVLISALGSSPNHSGETLIMTEAAKTLAWALDRQPKCRLLWISAIGVNEAAQQGHSYGCCEDCLPSCRLFCGYGCFGCCEFCCYVPCCTGREVWDDIGRSERVFTTENDFRFRSVIVRPTNLTPVSEHAAFTERWHKEGGNPNYQTRHANEAPPNFWVSRRAVAAFLLDCVEDRRFDGKSISLFQGKAGQS